MICVPHCRKFALTDGSRGKLPKRTRKGRSGGQRDPASQHLRMKRHPGGAGVIRVGVCAAYGMW
jgi:hypothetical protein